MQRSFLSLSRSCILQYGWRKKFHSSSRFHMAEMNAKKKDFYEVLGVSRDISKADLKKAYFQLAQTHHPDKNPNDAKAAEKFANISNAYEVLSDDAKRQQYDQFGEVQEGGGMPYHGAADAREMFENLFRSRQGFNLNLRVQMQLTFMEAAKGVSRTITIPSTDPCGTCSNTGVKVGTKPVTCPTCKGSGARVLQQMGMMMQVMCNVCQGKGQKVTPCPPCGGSGVVQATKQVKVDVPAGVDEDDVLQVPNQGNVAKGYPRGHLLIEFRILSDPVFKRDRYHVRVEVPVDVCTAMLGGSVNVPTLNGEATLKVKPGTQPNAEVVMRGKGIAPHQGNPGHQYVTFKVMLPEKLTDQQKELVEALAKSLPQTTGVSTGQDPEDKSFFQKIADKISGST